MRLRPIPWPHLLSGVPALAVLLAAVVLAGSAGSPTAGRVLPDRMGVRQARDLLLATAPVGTPVDLAMARLRQRNLSCAASEAPLATLTWPVIRCSTTPASGGPLLRIDVAARNGTVADIGVEDLACLTRADVVDPVPRPLDCDMSSKRLLALEAQRRNSESAFLADILGEAASPPKPRR